METNPFQVSTICIKTITGIEILKPQDILYCRIKDEIVKLKLSSSETVIAKHSLKELETKLSLYFFYRCHANCLINLQCVRRYIHKSGEITMIDGTIIIVAKERKVDFYKVMLPENKYAVILENSSAVFSATIVQ